MNKEVIMKTEKDKKDKYGRYLGEIFLLNEPVSVNTLLKEYAEYELDINLY